MFSESIQPTQLSNAASERVFARVTGASIYNDSTFVSTLRALVFPRMPESDTLILDYIRISISAAPTLPQFEGRDLINEIVSRDFTQPGHLSIVDFSNSTVADAWSTWVKQTFIAQHPGYTRVDKVTDFYCRVFPVQCYINPAIKSSVVFTFGLNIPRMHYLQCGVFAYLPWYFNPADGASDDEMALIESLRQRTPNEYQRLIGVFADKYNLREIGIRTLLDGFEAKYERVEIERITDMIRDNINQIDSLNQRISEVLRAKRDLEIRLLGLQSKMEGAGESEIMSFFLNHDNLTLGNVTDDKLYFTVRAPLQYWDEDIAESLLSNPSSFFYAPNGRKCDNIIPHDDMRRLLSAVFIDYRVKINFCATYEFSLMGNVRGLSHNQYDGCEGYAPNPHIHFYSCMGDYTRYVNQFLRDNDYIGAITQCIASCQSLNLGDYAVLKEFMKLIYGLDGQVSPRCFVMPDGQILTAKEAAAALSADE